MKIVESIKQQQNQHLPANVGVFYSETYGSSQTWNSLKISPVSNIFNSVMFNIIIVFYDYKTTIVIGLTGERCTLR